MTRRILTWALAVVLVAPGARAQSNPAVLRTINCIAVAVANTPVCFGSMVLQNGLSPISAVHETGSGATAASVNNTSVVWVGGPDVTTGNGYPLQPGYQVAVGTQQAAGVCVVGNTVGDGLCAMGN